MSGGGDISGIADNHIVHASCVAFRGRGLLFRGASGSGKSGLALEMMAMGCDLAADDRVVLERRGEGVIAHSPPPIAGLIEARGIGLLNARPCDPVPVVCVVDLDRCETARMPPHRKTLLLGQSVDLLLKVESPHFSAALMQYLKQGRRSQE